MSESQFRGAHKKSKACRLEDPLVELYPWQKATVRVNFRIKSAFDEAKRICRKWNLHIGDEKSKKLGHFSYGEFGKVITTYHTVLSFTLDIEKYETFRDKWCQV